MNNSNISITFSRGICLSIAAVLLALLIGLLAIPQPARALTYVVTNSNDSGDGSLREAISEANKNPGPDLIIFAAVTDGHAIKLTGKPGEDKNAFGDLDILDGGDLTIRGNGGGNTIIKGGGLDRVFHVCPGSGCDNTVIFENLTILEGHADSDDGGGIYIVAGTTTLLGSRVLLNWADSDGGGIYNKATLNVLKGSVIGAAGAGNTASSDGGGVYNDTAGMMIVNDSTVSGNRTINDNGGGIYNRGTLVIQDDSTVNDNRADYSGGGIYNDSGTTTVDGSTISANLAHRSGGGIYNGEAMLNVENGSTISNNRADTGAGGGILNRWGGTTTVMGSTVSDNVADSGGGGIAADIDSNTTVDGSIVSDNTAERGGGISNNGTLNVIKGSTIGGIGAGNTADEGGGIYNRTGTMTVDGSTISGNSVPYLGKGGGIYNEGTLEVQNGSAINGNTTADFGIGGGIYNSEGTTTVDGSNVSANTAGYGGGIWNEEGGTLTVINGSTIGGASAGNRSDHYGGGIVNTPPGSTTTVTDSRILHNTAAGNGGGVDNLRNFAGATSVTGSCIVGNSDLSYYNFTSAEQIATGNWWGAAAGPNTLGADTSSESVDVDNHWTTPILGCAPDLQVSKANDTGGKGTIGTPFHWRLTVRNSGYLSATLKPGETILVDQLPAGAAYGKPKAGSFVDVITGANIQCSLDGNTLICKAAGGAVTLGPLTGSFEVTFSVTPRVLGTLVNPEGICRVDPDGKVEWDDESNNDCGKNVVKIDVLRSYLYLPVVLK